MYKRQIRKILKAFDDDPKAAACAGDKELGCIEGITTADIAAIRDMNLRKRLFEEYAGRMADGNNMVFPFEDTYPSRLKEIYDRPNVIYYKGRLPSDEKMLYSQLLDFSPKSLETLIKETGMSQMQVFQALLTLELKGLIKEISKNFYIRIL